MFIVAFALLILVGVPVLIFAGVRLRTSGAVNRAASVGQTLGFQQGPPQKSVFWHLGEEGGRAVGIVPVAIRATGRGTAPTAWMGLRLVMWVDRLSDVVVYRPFETPDSLETFDHAFGSTRADTLSPAARDALLAFARAHFGEVRLRPRLGAHPELIPAAVMPDAPCVLTHDFTKDADDPAQVRLRLQAMRAVVAAVEAS